MIYARLREELSGDCQRISAPAGAVVFRAGEDCAGIHWVESGTLGLRKSSSNGRTVLTRLIHPGEPLGHRTFFADGYYSSTAVALASSELCFFPRGAIDRVLSEAPELTRGFLRRLARDLQLAEEAKLSTCAVPVRGRLAHLLLDLADRYGEDLGPGGVVLRVPLARGDMAELIGVRAESIARAIRSLEEDALVRFKGRRLSIPSLEALVGAHSSGP